jgi:hypothetical protein
LQAEFVYLLIDEGAYSSEELELAHNLVATLFRLENSASPGDVETGLAALNRELDETQSDEIERSFDIWLEQILGPRFPEIDLDELRDRGGETMLAQRLDEWYDNALSEGEQKGRKEGRKEGRKDLVADLIGQRFGPPPDAIRERLAAITSAEELTRLATRVFQVSSVEELWAD